MSDKAYSDPDDFQDPLENYEPKVYADPLEEALAEETVEQIRHEPMATISPDTPVHEAVKQLAVSHVACLLVEQDGKLLGVFSDRDILDKVALEFETEKDHPVRDVMTTNPIYVYESDASAAAFSVMAVAGYRHVPVLDLNQALVGVVSPQRVTSFLKQHLTKD